MPKPKVRYGRHDGHAVRYTYDEAWELVDGAWREIEPVFVARLTRQVYLETFGRVPPLPPAAFDPWRKRPARYGCDDGFAVRFRDHEAWACYADGKVAQDQPDRACLQCRGADRSKLHANVRPGQSPTGAAAAGRCFLFRLGFAAGLNIST